VLSPVSTLVLATPIVSARAMARDRSGADRFVMNQEPLAASILMGTPRTRGALLRGMWERPDAWNGVRAGVLSALLNKARENTVLDGPLGQGCLISGL
jgi:hypothetical protein